MSSRIIDARWMIFVGLKVRSVGVVKDGPTCRLLYSRVILMTASLVRSKTKGCAGLLWLLEESVIWLGREDCPILRS